MKAQIPDTVITKARPIKATILHQGKYTSVLYTVNDEPLTGSTLKALLKTYPPAAAELHKYRAQKRLAFLLLPVFVSATTIGGIQADKQKNSAGSAFSKAPVPFSISVGAFLGTLVLLVANDHFEKAVEVYNSQFNGPYVK